MATSTDKAADPRTKRYDVKNAPPKRHVGKGRLLPNTRKAELRCYRQCLHIREVNFEKSSKFDCKMRNFPV
jgi:hypothetical protein